MTPSPVDWGGLHNARDLGGLGGVIALGALFRSPRLDGLDGDGWARFERSGVRTIVDLRNDDEVAPLPSRPAGVRVIRAPIEDQADTDFMAAWGTSLGTPDYYSDNLRRWPSLVAAAISAVADAPEGGVLVHCAAGRDRTGLVVALLLRVAGVDAVDVLHDYEVGMRETNAFLRSHPQHETALDDDELATAVEAKRASLGGLLADLDVNAYLVAAGVSRVQLERLRARLTAR